LLKVDSYYAHIMHPNIETNSKPKRATPTFDIQ